MKKHEKIEKARYLRQVQTEVEELLWEELRNNSFGVKFRRQHPVDMFILDFYCPKYKLAVELDGAPHLTEEGKKYDAMRTEFLENSKIKVLRFMNSQIQKSMGEVIRIIKNEID